MSKSIICDKINYDDIPELTKEDFARGVKNPLAGKLKKGYTIIVEHADHDEIITVTKKKRKKEAGAASSLCVAETNNIYNE